MEGEEGEKEEVRGEITDTKAIWGFVWKPTALGAFKIYTYVGDI